MKLISVIRKSVKEQLRNFWLLVLTLSMAPFFVMIYYLINESSEKQYNIIVLNQDTGVEYKNSIVNHGDILIKSFQFFIPDTLILPISLTETDNRESAEKKLKDKKGDILVIIPKDFSKSLLNLQKDPVSKAPAVEFVGDLTNFNYMLSAVWAFEFISQYVLGITGTQLPLTMKETSLGLSGEIDQFDLYVQGLLIIALMRLMFTASIAIVTEVENKTMIRLKLSRLKTLEFLVGVSFVQLLIGILALFLTLGVAIGMGFNYTGSFAGLIVVGILTSLSIIAFSLIIAAFTKTVNEILVIGNFPLFLFMFFTGAAFPLEGNPLFSVAGYPVTIQGFMSPTQ
ncbi:MAG: ABC transporter permease, partial [Bacteroidales bacterium]|nr:ABC transporter permease [Bacteroidales bacterium]